MKKILWGILLAFILAATMIYIGYYYFILQPNTVVKDDGIIYIREDDSFETVLLTLQSKEYIKNTTTLRTVARLKEYTQSVKSGRYRIQNGMNNNQLINMLRSGRQEPIHFTFNNIRTLEDFAGIVSKQLAIDSSDFLKLTQDSNYVEALGFTPTNFIAMFIPNTYQIYWNTTTVDFIKKMNAEYHKFWTAERLEKAKQAGFSPMDIIIIASIVEEETNQTSELPIIAGIYINRLNKGWKLGACPTLKFALGDFSLRRILDKHLEIDSPYNTYKNTGLPPGPVRMPSPQVIDAVLNYEHHEYMFFCAKSDFSGTHHFSRTLRQHNQYAAEYHKALNKRKIY
ncbi:MAG: endolytic transglycosylase MltG [Odoribacter sp.]